MIYTWCFHCLKCSIDSIMCCTFSERWLLSRKDEYKTDWTNMIVDNESDLVNVIQNEYDSTSGQAATIPTTTLEHDPSQLISFIISVRHFSQFTETQWRLVILYWKLGEILYLNTYLSRLKRTAFNLTQLKAFLDRN